MPLRSVEAATRDDAIAAAREQYGPTARVVGVRRVRSGGVLGFFATERYVAEVAPDAAGRAAVPLTAAPRSAEAGRDESPADFSSPLASAAPARARAAAPARNGAAAWAAEAARSSRDLPSGAPISSPSLPRVTPPVADDAWPAAAPRTAAPARAVAQPVDHERVSELAGLLAAQPTTPEMPAQPRARYTRAEFQRSGAPRDGAGSIDDIMGGSGFATSASSASASAAPSPFTAALARMVAGDRDVRQAVREALDDPAAPRPRSNGDSRPVRPGALGPADTSVASPATRQKEETVGDQVIAPSTFVDQPREVPAWAAEPEVVAPSASSREEAIAEVLRSALAQGHSDEALAAILRKVLAGVAPQTALAEPEAPVRPAPDVVLPVDIARAVAVPAPAEPTTIAAPLAVEPVRVEVAPVEAAVVEMAPVAAQPVPPVAAPAPLFPTAVSGHLPPAPLFSAPAAFFAAPAPYSPPPLFAPSVDSMWGDPSPAPLWGDPVTVTVTRTKQSVAPIWAEVAQEEAVAGTEVTAAADDTVETVEDAIPAVEEDTFEPADLETVSAEDVRNHEMPALEVTAVEVPAVEVPAVEVPAVEIGRHEAAALEACVAEVRVAEVPEAPVVEVLGAEGEVAEAEVHEAEVAPVEATPELVAPIDTEVARHVEDLVAQLLDDVAADEVVEFTVAEVPHGAETEIVHGDETADDADARGEAVTTTVEDGTVGETAPPVETETEAPIVETEAAIAEIAEIVETQVEIADTVEAEIAEPEIAVQAEAEEAAVETEITETETEVAEAEMAVQAEAVEAAVETETVLETETLVEEVAPMLARTASDPAPMMSLDATTVMPPLSLLPPLPSSRGRGRPPVPPASRPLTPRGSSPAAPPKAPPAGQEPVVPAADLETPDRTQVMRAPRSLATVTRLPVGPLMATPETPEMPELDADDLDGLEALTSALLAEFQPVAGEPDAVQPSTDVVSAQRPVVPGDLRGRLEALGLPAHLLGNTFADDVAALGTYAALTRALGLRLPAAPELPSGAADVLFVVGPGFETLRAARSLAVSLRLDPDGVQWATRGELAGLAGKGSRITTIDTAMDRSQDAASSGTVTIVAVDAPLRTDAYWMSQMLAIWAPTAVWVVVEATRKPEDLGPWIEALPRVDALVVTDTDVSADPAAVLRQVAAPVALLDGVRATPHRWASLLCERLESTTT